MNPFNPIDQAFLQLEFAIRSMTYAELGKIVPADFDTDVQINLDRENIVFPAGHFSSRDEIVLAAQNNYMLTLGFTVIVLEKALEAAGFPLDDPAEPPCRDLRDLVYMIRCAFAHDMMRPRWEAKGPFARLFHIDLPSGPLTVDTRVLHEKPFEEAHIGGIERYFDMMVEVRRLVANPAVQNEVKK